MKLKDGEGGKTIENFEKLYSLIRPVNIRLYKPKREKRTTISRLKTAWVAHPQEDAPHHSSRCDLSSFCFLS